MIVKGFFLGLVLVFTCFSKFLYWVFSFMGLQKLRLHI